MKKMKHGCICGWAGEKMLGFQIAYGSNQGSQHMDKWHLWLKFFKRWIIKSNLKAAGTKVLCMAVFCCIISSGFFADTEKGN